MLCQGSNKFAHLATQEKETLKGVFNSRRNKFRIQGHKDAFIAKSTLISLI